MSPTFVGSHRMLRAMRPSDTAAILFIMTLAAMFVGRYLFEGIPYQVSFSAMIGDTAGLIVVALRGQEVLKRQDVHIPASLQRGDIHVAIISASFILFLLMDTCTPRLHASQGQVMDIYHDLVIAPMFLYLAVTLVPVIVRNATGREKFEVGAYGAVWVNFGVIDWATGMIAQRPWLAEHFHVVWPVLWSTINWAH